MLCLALFFLYENAWKVNKRCRDACQMAVIIRNIKSRLEKPNRACKHLVSLIHPDVAVCTVELA